MKENPPEFHKNKDYIATQGGEIKRKLDAARARWSRLNKQWQTYRGENETNEANAAREALKKLQDEIMWLEMQLQSLDAGIGMFRVEPREAGPNKLARLSIQIQEEAQGRLSQFQAELDKLEDEALRIRRLYLGVVSKMGQLLREANRTTILLEKVQGYIPNDRRLKRKILRNPQLGRLVIPLSEIQSQVERPDPLRRSGEEDALL